MIYACCDPRRRIGVLASSLNGIDFLEVLDDQLLPDDKRQRTLYVHLLKPYIGTLTGRNVKIEGGERIRDVAVVDGPIAIEDPDKKILTIKVTKPGDFSTYTLRLVNAANPKDPPDGFDRLMASVDFSFKVECPSDFDCKPAHVCPPGSSPEPEIDYLSKDYTSFRRLMLDRMAVLMPDWKERNAADMGVALVELLAYAGDSLSYQQDAVATEAYLATSRRRVSVRRHARLVDYLMHDGSNARAWVRATVNADNVVLKKNTRFFTRVPGKPVRLTVNSREYFEALAAQPEVFESLLPDTHLFTDHNEMNFYTWRARECCLPAGSVSATLAGKLDKLKVGDVLVFAEVKGPRTGRKEDADQTHRHAVKLSRITLNEDKIGGQFKDQPDNSSVPVTEIEWVSADALPFSLCISSRVDTSYYDGVSVAWGNIVLADHGLKTDQPEDLGTVPQPLLTRLSLPSADRCQNEPPGPVPPRFRPRLQQSPLTQAAPYDEKNPPPSATAAMQWTPRDPVPALSLTSTAGTDVRPWDARRDLLRSAPEDSHFVVEIEDNGDAFVRFGDDHFGFRPPPDLSFTAKYRIGNGVRGNIGADAIAHIVTNDDGFDQIVTNPMPAQGGLEPESSERVRQDAPSAFRVQERAVTTADYEAVAERDPQVLRAAAGFHWTGSWYTVFLMIDRLGGLPMDDTFKAQLLQRMELYRMAGNDLEITGPSYVPLEIEMFVCARPGYFSSDVKAALLSRFSSTTLPGGQRGFFHPDNYTFGQSVYLGPVYQSAQELDGVASVDIRVFQKQGSPNTEWIQKGKLEVGRFQIARLANDPNFPDRGVLRVTVQGGK